MKWALLINTVAMVTVKIPVVFDFMHFHVEFHIQNSITLICCTRLGFFYRDQKMKKKWRIQQNN